MAQASVCILDYGSGNVRSVYNMLCTLTKNCVVSNDPVVIDNATHLILPGVGAYGSAMQKIHQQIPVAHVHAVVQAGKPFLGICVGMQVLGVAGYEFGEHKGLGWLPGSVRKLDSQGLPLPHIGWNNLHVSQAHPLMSGIAQDADVYFVHSYVYTDIPDEYVIATTDHGSTFASVVGRDNIMGVQFHPEKSQKVGATLLSNFLDIQQQ